MSLSRISIDGLDRWASQLEPPINGQFRSAQTQKTPAERQIKYPKEDGKATKEALPLYKEEGRRSVSRGFSSRFVSSCGDGHPRNLTALRVSSSGVVLLGALLAWRRRRAPWFSAAGWAAPSPAPAPRSHASAPRSVSLARCGTGTWGPPSPLPSWSRRSVSKRPIGVPVISHWRCRQLRCLEFSCDDWWSLLEGFSLEESLVWFGFSSWGSWSLALSCFYRFLLQESLVWFLEWGSLVICSFLLLLVTLIAATGLMKSALTTELVNHLLIR